MMFVGAIPRICVEQAFRVIDLSSVTKAFVCCSGSFRFEQALALKHPNIEVHSNDVSLLSVALGRMAVGEPLPFHFKGDLAFLEDVVASREPSTRFAALAVALRMCHFRGANAHVRAHVEHYQKNAAHYVDEAKDRVAKYLATLKVSRFFAGDFRDHADEAVRRGAWILAWPPTHKGDYERFYRLIHTNTEWSPPDYRVFNPDELPRWLATLNDAGARYCICSDRLLKGHAPVAVYTAGRSKRVYVYSSVGRASSVRRTLAKAEPFRYVPVEVSKLRADSRVTVVEAPSAHMNFIKDKYQLAGLVHTNGEMQFLVYVDGQLAGGFVYARMKTANFSDPRISKLTALYLMSDFSISRERRLSKLIAILATGREAVRRFDLRKVHRTRVLLTTAFTERPVSMKYRGIFELVSRKPGMLNYLSEVRYDSNDGLYAEWWKRFAANAYRAGSASGPEAA